MSHRDVGSGIDPDPRGAVPVPLPEGCRPQKTTAGPMSEQERLLKVYDGGDDELGPVIAHLPARTRLVARRAPDQGAAGTALPGT